MHTIARRINKQSTVLLVTCNNYKHTIDSEEIFDVKSVARLYPKHYRFDGNPIV